MPAGRHLRPAALKYIIILSCNVKPALFRQPENKIGAVVNYTLRFYFAVVQFNKHFNKIKPHARAFRVIASGFIDLIKAFKNLFCFFRFYSVPAVGNSDRGSASGFKGFNLNKDKSYLCRL